MNHPHIKANVKKWLSTLAKLPADLDSFIKSSIAKSQLISINNLKLDESFKDNFTLIAANHSSGIIGRQVEYDQLTY